MSAIAPQQATERSLTEQAFEAVLNMIKSGALVNGEVISERRLAELLGLSRTPIREALGRLESRHFLRRSGRTLLVNGVELAEILEIMAVRKLLEADAARQAAGRMSPGKIADIRARLLQMTSPATVTADYHWEVDDLLHLSIADTGGNRLLQRLIAELRVRTRLFGKETVPGRFAPGREEHLAILAAIEAGDGEAAAAAMVRHIEGARQAIVQSVTGLPPS